MQVKVVPEPPASLDDVASVRDALPRVPRSESDCCGRLADRVEWVDDRDAAREWLVFLAGVGLANRTADGGYVRGEARSTNDDDSDSDRVDRDEFVAALRNGVFAAGPVLDALDADEPRDAATALAAVEPDLPTWERRRRPDVASIWRERVERLLEWWVLLGEAALADDGYVHG